MDVTPQSLKDVEFRQALRGYDPDEVDMFLQRVSAGVAQLQGRLSEAISRAEAAEARIDRGDTVAPTKRARSTDEPSEETITRTLLLAQQTADKLLTEARDEASSTLTQVQNEAAEVRGEAQAEAEQLRRVAKQETDELRSTAIADTDEMRAVAEAETSKQRRETQSKVDALLLEAEHASTKASVEAEAERSAILGEVESEARAVAEETRKPLLAEIRELENHRDFLAEDVALLEHHVDAERSTVLESIARLQSVIDEPDALRVSTVPELSRYSKLEERPEEATATSVAEQPIDLTDADTDVDSVVAESASKGAAGIAEEAEEAEEVEEIVDAELIETDAVDTGSDEIVDAELVDTGSDEIVDAELVDAELVDGELADVEASEPPAAQADLAESSAAASNPETSGLSSSTGAMGATAVAGASAGSFIDRFGATPAAEPHGEALEVLTDIDVVLEDSDEVIESDAAEVTTSDLDLSDRTDLAATEVGDVVDFERTPIADDLGFVDPTESSNATEVFDHQAEDSSSEDSSSEDSSSEDSVLPVFDDDDFFSVDDTSSDEQVEVIDLTNETATHSTIAAVPSTDEPTQAFSVETTGDESTEAADAIDLADGADEPTGDAFLEELRRAVSEDDGEADDDPALVAFFDDDSDGPTKRFGRQR